MRDCLVDVAFGTYNHVAYVSQAIKSVLTQKTNFGVRLVIADDCSTDGTQEIIREYARQYPDRIVTFLDHVHRGLHDPERAYLKVLAFCNAKYVALLEGDDYWTNPHKLQKQVDLMTTRPDMTLCFHDVLVRYEDASRDPHRFHYMPRQAVFQLEDILQGNFVPTCSGVFKREVLVSLPSWFWRATGCDWIMCVLAAQRGCIGFIDECMGVYRRHGESFWQGQSRVIVLRRSIETGLLIRRLLDPKTRTVLDRTLLGWSLEGFRVSQQEGDHRQTRWFAWQTLRRWSPSSLTSRNTLLKAVVGLKEQM